MKYDLHWNEWQVEAWECMTPDLCISGGLACGKTAFAGMWTPVMAYMIPGVRLAVSAPTYDQLLGSTFLEIRRFLEQHGLRWRMEPHTNNEVLVSNGSRFRLVTHATTPAHLKSYEYDGAWEDEGDAVDEASHAMYADRVGRSEHALREVRARDLKVPVERIGQFRVSCNPVPYGHHLYRRYKQEATENQELWEVPTYANRRNLAPGYIEKLEARYPEGTALHNKWLLGKCGVPMDAAVFSEFQSGEHTMTPAQFARAKVYDWHGALHLAVGATTWLQCARLRDGTIVATHELTHHGRAAEHTIKQIGRLNKARHTITDRDDELIRDHGKLGLVHLRAPERVGYSRLTALIALGKFRLLLDDNGEPVCRELRNQLDTHVKIEGTQEPEKGNRTLILPATYIAGRVKSGVTKEGIRKSGLQGVLEDMSTRPPEW